MKNILRLQLFGDQIIQNCLKIDATHLYNNGLLARQETQKRFHTLEAYIITFSLNDAFFTGRAPNDRHYVCLSYKTLLY